MLSWTSLHIISFLTYIDDPFFNHYFTLWSVEKCIIRVGQANIASTREFVNHTGISNGEGGIC